MQTICIYSQMMGAILLEERQDFFVKLKASGLKNTKHRIKLLEILDSSSQPISADEIYAKIRVYDDRISLSTVYRSLEALAKNDLVNKVMFENDTRTSFEINRLVHHHFLICTDCNKIITVDDCPIHEYEEEVSHSRGFYVIGHKLELYGYCSHCAKKRNLNESHAH